MLLFIEIITILKVIKTCPASREKGHQFFEEATTKNKVKQKVASSNRPRWYGLYDPGKRCRVPGHGCANTTGVSFMSENLMMTSLDAADLMAIEGGRGTCHGGHRSHRSGGGGGGSLLNQILNAVGLNAGGLVGTNNGTFISSGNVFNFNF
jgi:hypothetical protein